VRALIAIAIAIAASVPVGTNAAVADPLDVECGGTQTVTFTPGLLLFPANHTITLRTIYSPCVLASEPALTAGQSNGTVQETRSCLDLARPGTATRLIAWNTGQTSTFTYNRIVTSVGADEVVTLTGTITTGLFAGRQTAVAVSAFAGCVAVGGRGATTTEVPASRLGVTSRPVPRLTDRLLHGVPRVLNCLPRVPVPPPMAVLGQLRTFGNIAHWSASLPTHPTHTGESSKLHIVHPNGRQIPP
jgi:hypothetical protein